MDTTRRLTDIKGYSLLEIMVATVLGAFMIMAAVTPLFNQFNQFFSAFTGSERSEAIRTSQWISRAVYLASDISVENDNSGFTARLDYDYANDGTYVWLLLDTPFDTSDDTFLRVKRVADDGKLHFLMQTGSAPAEPAVTDPELSDLTASSVSFTMANSSGSGDDTEMVIAMTLGSSPQTEINMSTAARNMSK